MSKNQYRPDREGTHQAQFNRNKKKIYATQSICAICGKPVDFELKAPHPMSKSIDHIIPVSRGGHPSDINNLQLAHLTCNRQKANRLYESETKKAGHKVEVVDNTVLPNTFDWIKYKSPAN